MIICYISKRLSNIRTSLVAQTVKCLSTMWETWVWSLGLIPGLGRFPGEGNGNPLQYFLPWKSHRRRSLVHATTHAVAKSRARLSDFTFTFFLTLTYPCIPKIRSVSFKCTELKLPIFWISRPFYHFFFYLISISTFFYSFLPNYFRFAIFLSLNWYYYC